MVPFGDRYKLVLEDGTEAEPGYFVTALPSWRVGDQVLTGTGSRYRIVAIEPPDESEADRYAATWTVKPLQRGVA